MQELECKNKKSDDKDIIERMAGYILILDIKKDKDFCENIPAKKCNEFEMCEDCIIDYFSKKCYWEQDEFCVNDNSEHLADFASPRRCGACNCFTPFKY